MSDLLSAVTTVITSFVSWMSSLTTALIGNAFVQIMFAIYIINVLFKVISWFWDNRNNPYKHSVSLKYFFRFGGWY